MQEMVSMQQVLLSIVRINSSKFNGLKLAAVPCFANTPEL
jgi:hypothetical protein